MDRQETEEQALKEFEAAKREFDKPRDGNKRAEQVYTKAYQKLVRLGLKPQIKKKYRGQ